MSVYAYTHRIIICLYILFSQSYISIHLLYIELLYVSASCIHRIIICLCILCSQNYNVSLDLVFIELLYVYTSCIHRIIYMSLHVVFIELLYVYTSCIHRFIMCLYILCSQSYYISMHLVYIELLYVSTYCIHRIITIFLHLVFIDLLYVYTYCILRVTVCLYIYVSSQNTSMSVVLLQWNISDFFYQQRDKISSDIIQDADPSITSSDYLWMCLYSKFGELCVDLRPAVRKSAGQTLFSTIAAHGNLLENVTWKSLLWKVQSHQLYILHVLYIIYN